MKDMYLTSYSVKGIKTLDQLITLSFYKKIISRNPNTQEYNIKGIYGINGAGKSGIIASVEILRNILTDPGYLSNPVAQKNLDEIINKKTGELFIEADYIVKTEDSITLFRYNVSLTKAITGKYIITQENLLAKNATSRSETMDSIFKVVNGEIVSFFSKSNPGGFSDQLVNKTMNLLNTASMSALFYEKIMLSDIEGREQPKEFLWAAIGLLYFLGAQIHVYLDWGDDHRTYVAQSSLESLKDGAVYKDEITKLSMNVSTMNNEFLNVFSVSGNIVSKSMYKNFKKEAEKLYDFLHIFKPDLQKIEVDRKENRDFWICDLVMVYESYKIHAEYESTGIKKLIKLFSYLKEMVRGGIVFIDEFDANLHDVYWCALLEYLMEYADGQLCFTTHNVGPMDILKRRKKSIDFLSEDHKIYSWKNYKKYSPSRLYRSGMIEGSPFNVDSTDFIGVLDTLGEDE